MYYEGWKRAIRPLHFDEFGLVPSSGKYLGQLTFSFLNKVKVFDEVIDWRFSGYGKLWNYNLQYGDYLLDQKVSLKDRISLVESCAEAIESGLLKLEPYPVSIRIANWCFFYSLTGYQSPLFLNILCRQIAFLKDNQEYHILANHLLENKIALCIAAAYTGTEAEVKQSLHELIEELEEQILPDGAHYECSPMYHSIILSRLIMLRSLISGNKSLPDARPLDKTLEHMAGWLKGYMFLSGRYAKFNDSADNIAPAPDRLFFSIRNFGLAVKERALQESGYRKLQNEHFEVLVKVGNITPSYQPGHTHSDMLSLCLEVDQIPVFIDPGVSTYEANEQRLVERGTLSHNTVTINNQNQSEIWGAFRVARRAKVKIEQDSPETLVASHTGYLKQFGVIHERTVSLKTGSLTIRDSLKGKLSTNGAAVCSFYLHPEIEFSFTGNEQLVLSDLLTLEATGGAIQIDRIMIPDGFNKLRETKRIRIRFRQHLETKILLSVKPSGPQNIYGY